MGKERDTDEQPAIPELSIEEQVRQELLNIQKGQRQLSEAEMECFTIALGGVIRAKSLVDLKILASEVKQKVGQKPYDRELELEFFRRRYGAAGTDEPMAASLNHLRVLLAQKLILQEVPETKFLGYVQRVVRHLSPVHTQTGRPVVTARVNRTYL